METNEKELREEALTATDPSQFWRSCIPLSCPDPDMTPIWPPTPTSLYGGPRYMAEKALGQLAAI